MWHMKLKVRQPCIRQLVNFVRCHSGERRHRAPRPLRYDGCRWVSAAENHAGIIKASLVAIKQPVSKLSGPDDPAETGPSNRRGQQCSAAYRFHGRLPWIGHAVDDGRGAGILPGIRKDPRERFWKFLCHHQSHVEWVGCSLHDLIQPSFSFLVGVALPFSMARRSVAGQPQLYRTLHAFWRH